LAFDELDRTLRTKARGLIGHEMEIGAVVLLDMDQERIDLGHEGSSAVR
jgi:hypothetical protein